MSEEVNPNLGMSRRQLIKRSAVVGGTVIWVAPMIQSLSSPAFGQAVGSPFTPPVTTTPTTMVAGKDFSYVVVVYNCGFGLKNVKFEFNDNGVVTMCESQTDVNAPLCNEMVDGLGAARTGNCTGFPGGPLGNRLFDVSSPNGGLSIVVSFVASAPGPCTFFSGGGVGKCGSDKKGECVKGVVSPDGESVSFTLCGV